MRRSGPKKGIRKYKQTKFQSICLPRLQYIKDLYRDGYTDKEIAAKLRMSFETYKKAKREPELQEIIKTTREEVDASVVNELYLNTQSFDNVEMSKATSTDALGNKVVTEKIAKKTVRGSVTAQKLWLTNRCPDRWKDTPEALIDANVTIVFSPEDDGL